RQIFQAPTIAALAQLADTTPLVVAEQGLVSGAASLTPIQHWFFAQHQPVAQHYNQALLLTTPAGLDLGRLAAVLAALEQQHDALRLRFTPEAGGWRQAHSLPAEERLPQRVDLAAVPDGAVAAAIEAAAAQVQASLDLAAGPLLRVVVFDLG